MQTQAVLIADSEIRKRWGGKSHMFIKRLEKSDPTFPPRVQLGKRRHRSLAALTAWEILKRIRGDGSREMTPCQQCGVEFTPTAPNRKFCTPACAYKARQARVRLDLPEKACETCGATYKPRIQNQRFCSTKCGTKANNDKRHAAQKAN